jgi:ATP-dependent Clp protease ATP-binding subunit ClpX
MILEELMLDLMYTIPGNNKRVKELVITEEMVKNREITIPLVLEKAG